GDRGTEVWVEIEYNPPGGALGAAIAKLFGEAPEQQIKGDLFRFKQVLETGEVVKSDSSIYRGPHPAQPPEGNAR
ncbi:MAG TPA: cyclase, partial [Blastocatellia bacterium]|nr:cyclase [Blastocatellia bacterium]